VSHGLSLKWIALNAFKEAINQFPRYRSYLNSQQMLTHAGGGFFNTDGELMMNTKAFHVIGYSHIMGITKGGEYVNFLKIHVLHRIDQSPSTQGRLTTTRVGYMPGYIYGDAKLADDFKEFSYPLALNLTIEDVPLKDGFISVATNVTRCDESMQILAVPKLN